MCLCASDCRCSGVALLLVRATGDGMGGVSLLILGGGMHAEALPVEELASPGSMTLTGTKHGGTDELGQVCNRA